MRYSLFRVSLAAREVPGLLQEMAESPTQVSRADYLKLAFGQNVEFSHRKVWFSYVFIGEQDGYYFGRVGRQVPEVMSSDPEHKLEEQRQSVWHAANLIVNTHGDSDGQILAFQNASFITSPSAVCDSLSTHINNTTVDKGWLMSINAISESKDFWSVVDSSRGKITDLELNFVAPNIFGGRDKTREALRNLRDKNNAQSLTTKVSNKDGALDPDSEEIRESIDYISEGGGSVKLKAGKKKLYDSEENATSVDVHQDEDFAVSDANTSLWKELIIRIYKK